MSDLKARLLKLAEEWWPLQENGINGWDELARTLLLEAARIGADNERFNCGHTRCVKSCECSTCCCGFDR